MVFIRSLFVTPLLLLIFALTTWGQASQPEYVSSYRAGSYKAAISQARAATKKDSRDGQAWYFLGLAWSKAEDYKNASKALSKAKEILPSDANVYAALAWTSFKSGQRSNAVENARHATKLDPKNASAYYVLSVAVLPDQNYSSAHQYASSAIAADPQFWAAYQVRAFTLIGSFARQMFTVLTPPSDRKDLLKQAVSDLTTFLQHAPDFDHGHFGKQYLESLKYFSENYRTPEEIREANALSDRTPYRITAKPKAEYSSQARSARIQGQVRLLVQLRDDGRVGHILLLTPLGYGLDEQAMKAASKIRFEPSKVNGNPVSTVVTVDYGFHIF